MAGDTSDGKPDSGGFKDVIGPNIDTTNPEAAKWFWEKIRDRYVKPYGFDHIWLDETEPDIDPAKDVFFIGSGTRFYIRICSFIRPRCTRDSGGTLRIAEGS
jgi:alpha-glucosidase/alpha-D-xyloside xylohydrolase